MTHKVALVTGAGSGIGRASSIALLEAGYHVVLAGRRGELLDAIVAEHGRGHGGEALAVPTDVTQPESVDALFARIAEKFGRLDVLFNNAGANLPGVVFEDISYEQWRGIVDVNLSGMFLVAQGAFRMMKAQNPRGGRIINNGSISAYAPRPDSAPYTSTKHAVSGLTKCISLDGRKYDIACGQIDIGNALTEISKRGATGAKQANGEVAVEAMMDVKHVADSIVNIAKLPLDVNVQFMTIMATKMPYVGRG